MSARNGSLPPAVGGDIQVIARCAQILRLFSTTQRTLRIADVASELDLQRTTVHRYLTSMANADLLERDADGCYRLGPLQVQLGTVALRGLRVLEIADPYVQRLANDANETAVLAVWGGLGPVVARVHESDARTVNIVVRVGSPLPLEAAQSQVFLAFLKDPGNAQRLLSQLPDGRRGEIQANLELVRRDGCLVSSEVVQGIRAIAAPVFDGHGDICATVALVGTVSGIPDAPDSGMALALLHTAARLSHELGYSGRLPFQDLIETSQTA
ncbi:MAG: IclR family transcriptional regulator [Micromonosporaceae bacterium]